MFQKLCYHKSAEEAEGDDRIAELSLQLKQHLSCVRPDWE